MAEGTYRDVADRLIAAGYAYTCFCTQEELDQARERAKAEGRTPGYDGTCRTLTHEQRTALTAAGRPFVVRFRMPDRDWTWDDLVRGDITFARDHVPDYVLVRANGEPLYTRGRCAHAHHPCASW